MQKGSHQSCLIGPGAPRDFVDKWGHQYGVYGVLTWWVEILLKYDLIVYAVVIKNVIKIFFKALGIEWTTSEHPDSQGISAIPFPTWVLSTSRQVKQWNTRPERSWQFVSPLSLDFGSVSRQPFLFSPPRTKNFMKLNRFGERINIWTDAFLTTRCPPWGIFSTHFSISGSVIW